jgi:hypothetical protein
MAIKIMPRQDQLAQLALLRDLPSHEIDKIVTSLSEPQSNLLKPSELSDKLSKILIDRESDAVSISRLLISLYTLCRQRDLSVSKLLDGLQSGIQASDSAWTDEELRRWQDVVPSVNKLLSNDNISTIVKALDLSYDYANLFQSAKIITDIRPVFDNNLEVSAAVISFTLRVYYDDLEGSKNISIALDEKDINSLIRACNRALDKGSNAKKFMIKSNINRTFICGENNDSE